MDRSQRIFTHNSVGELLDQATEDILQHAKKWQSDEAWQAERQKRCEEHEAKYAPLHDKYEKATTPLKVRIKPRTRIVSKGKIEYLEETEEEIEIEIEKSMIIEIGLNGVPERKRKGKEREQKEGRLLEQSRRKDGEPPHWITQNSSGCRHLRRYQ